MIGPLAAGKKGAELGYKVYGVPGAVAAGAGGAAGMLVAKKGLEVTDGIINSSSNLKDLFTPRIVKDGALSTLLKIIGKFI